MNVSFNAQNDYHTVSSTSKFIVMQRLEIEIKHHFGLGGQ